MAVYDLYGIDAESIFSAREILQAMLPIKLEEHESSFHRGPYFSTGNFGEENFELKENIDPFEDAPNEPEFSDIRFLLYVNNTKRSLEISKELSKSNGSINLLRHEDI